MLSAFTSILHVPNLSQPDHVVAVLEDCELFTPQEIKSISKKMQGAKVFIGIKKLLALVDMVRQTDAQHRVIKFLSKLEEEGGLDHGTSVH